MTRVRLGYFENFKGANTILLCGDGDGLQRLADLLRPLEDANAEPVNLHVLSFVQVYGGVSLTAHPVVGNLEFVGLGRFFHSHGTSPKRVGLNPPKKSRKWHGR